MLLQKHKGVHIMKQIFGEKAPEAVSVNGVRPLDRSDENCYGAIDHHIISLLISQIGQIECIKT